MASQIYSRYIPPSKNKASAISHNPQPPTTSQIIPGPTPLRIRNDTSSTYARYIPSSKTKTKITAQSTGPEIKTESPCATAKRKHEEFVEEVAGPIKKSKKHKKENAYEQYEERPAALKDLSVEYTEETTGQTESKKARFKTTAAGVNLDDRETVDKEDDARHKKLMEKRERSLKKAEKLAKKSTKEFIPEYAVVEEPPELHDLVPLPQPEPVAEAPIQSISASLPQWLANPIRILPTTSAAFIEVGVGKGPAEALQKRGFREAFAVQAAVLPLLLPGSSQQEGDVLVSAATGSGKTLAYILPMIEDISRNRITKLRGLVVLPTRELVGQAREVSEMCASVFAGRRRVRIGTAVGNDTFKAEQASLVDQELVYDPECYRRQQKRLNAKWESSDYGSDGDLCDDEVVSSLPDHVLNPVSKVDILICTPGRLVEHLKSTPGFTLEFINWLVVDEADKLLDQSFQQWLDTVMAELKNPRKIIVSATITRDIGQLSGLKLYRPKLIVLEGDQEQGSRSLFLPSLLVESGIKVDDEGVKPLYMVEVLKREGLIPQKMEEPSPSEDSSLEDESDDSREASPEVKPKAMSDLPRGVLIFTKSNETAVRLGRLIALLEPSCADEIGTLTSTTRSSARKAALKSFESGKLSILVASDLVSRGLDLPNLGHVINYDIPTSLTGYVHRVGRTARAGKRGHAWTLFTGTEGRWFWNEIGRAEGVRRSGKVERVNINVEVFERQRARYEKVLAELGREAGERGK